MKKNVFFFLAITAIVLSSCGKGGIKPKSVKINGPLGEFFEVIEREYKFVSYESNDDLLQLNVEFKRIKEGGPKDASSSSRPTFTVSIIDDDENVIAIEATDLVIDKEHLESIFALKVDETSAIPFKFDKEEAKVTEFFKVTSKWNGENEIQSRENSQPEPDASTDTQELKKYSVVVCSHPEKEKALQLQKELKDIGYSSSIHYTSQRQSYRVIVYTSDSRSSALSYLNNIRDLYPDAWLLNESGGGSATTTSSAADTGNHLAVINVSNIILPPEISDAVTIVPQSEGNVYCDFNHNYYPEVTLTFKLLRSVNTASLSSEYGQMWIVGHALDSEGREIEDLNPKGITSREWRTGDSDGKEFKEFLEGNVGGTITMHFRGENNIEDIFEKDQSVIEAGHNMVRNAAKEFKKFKLRIINGNV